MLEQLLDYVVETNSSDLHLSSNNFPTVRTDGDLTPIPSIEKLSNKVMLNLLHGMMNERQKTTYKEKLELDFSIKGKNGNRFRVNAFNNIDGPAASFRLIPSHIMTSEEIMAPPAIDSLCKLSRGLVLVVGPTGSGKSTTLATMINNINKRNNDHIITIEDPVEFIFKSNKCLINQREVGHDTLSFPKALKSALREDPDIIMVGEMRDLETIRLALTAAETGHLVLATLHTNSAAQSINRIIDVFPAHDKEIIRSMLSSSIQGVISQRLVKKTHSGRCAAYEIMIANNSIRNLIRENKIPQIYSMIEVGKKHGMVTMKESLMDLVYKDHIDRKEAEDLLASFGLQS